MNNVHVLHYVIETLKKLFMRIEIGDADRK